MIKIRVEKINNIEIQKKFEYFNRLFLFKIKKIKRYKFYIEKECKNLQNLNILAYFFINGKKTILLYFNRLYEILI